MSLARWNPFARPQCATTGRARSLLGILCWPKGLRWFPARETRRDFRGRIVRPLNFTIASKGRTGAADRSKLMRQARALSQRQNP